MMGSGVQVTHAAPDFSIKSTALVGATHLPPQETGQSLCRVVIPGQAELAPPQPSSVPVGRWLCIGGDSQRPGCGRCRAPASEHCNTTDSS